MKPTVLKTFILLLVIANFSSCSKDDSSKPNFPEENFLAVYLRQSGFDEFFSININSSLHESGTEFTPLVKGKINSLKLKLPAPNPNLRVTIWDSASKTILRTEIVHVINANTEYTFDIVDIPLIINKEYAISFSSDDRYLRKQTDDGAANYPITVGNIRINSYVYEEGTTQTYPTRSITRSYSGDLSFNFQQTE